MKNLEELFNTSKISTEKYDELVEYFEDRFNKEGVDVLMVESEDRTSTRFDFAGQTSVWVNGAAIEGTLRKGTQKVMKRVIENAPIKVENYVSYM